MIKKWRTRLMPDKISMLTKYRSGPNFRRNNSWTLKSLTSRKQLTSNNHCLTISNQSPRSSRRKSQMPKRERMIWNMHYQIPQRQMSKSWWRSRRPTKPRSTNYWLPSTKLQMRDMTRRTRHAMTTCKLSVMAPSLIPKLSTTRRHKKISRRRSNMIRTWQWRWTKNSMT